MTHSLTTWHGQHHADRMTGGGKAFELNHSGYLCLDYSWPVTSIVVQCFQRRRVEFTLCLHGSLVVCAVLRMHDG